MSETKLHLAGPLEIATPEAVAEARDRLVEQVSRVIVGQREVIEQLLIALFAQGHCLFIGVPGLAKTLLVRTTAQALHLRFSRIQFTPDLMPSDITGTDLVGENPETGRREYCFIPGPVFANVILADEINRTPPKTQSALLQAMQELQVTAGGATRPLDPPFFVLATQNPIEQEGTYPLPEAQLDRFMLSIHLDYPSGDEEMLIARATTGNEMPEAEPIMTADEIIRCQRLVREIPISDHVLNYAVRLVRSTRPNDPSAPAYVREWVTWGAGPRATQCLTLGGKSAAALRGAPNVSCEDIRALARPVLRHRIIPSFAAEAEGLRADDIVGRLLRDVRE
ncbi:MAG: MoxR family ATPase [Armatimonadetes bacterium]|nr:MoxR family ATPase [Armatimonadota bacterium]